MHAGSRGLQSSGIHSHILADHSWCQDMAPTLWVDILLYLFMHILINVIVLWYFLWLYSSFEFHPVMLSPYLWGLQHYPEALKTCQGIHLVGPYLRLSAHLGGSRHGDWQWFTCMVLEHLCMEFFRGFVYYCPHWEHTWTYFMDFLFFYCWWFLQHS